MRANAMYILAAGLSIGYIMGMSLSPVVSIVLSSIVAVVVAVTSAAAGIDVHPEILERPGTDVEEKPDQQPVPIRSVRHRVEVHAMPIAALVIGIAFGGTVGLAVRGNHWLGSAAYDTRNRGAGNGEVQKPDTSRIARIASPPARSELGFFGVSKDDCSTLNGEPPGALLANIKNYVKVREVTTVAENCPSDRCLRALVKLVCKP
jgi:hypothetical protein